MSDDKGDVVELPLMVERKRRLRDRRRAAAPDLEQTAGSPGGLIDAAPIPPRNRRRGVGRIRRDRR